MMGRYVLGYTQGVFDLFHVGHLSLINRAASMCERLIVGVNSDALVRAYKNKTPVIPEENRAQIVRNLKSVYECKVVTTLDKVELFRELHFDAVFIGDDWKGNPRWIQTEKDLSVFGVDVVYLPHTPNISSSLLRPEEKNRVE